MTSILTWVVDHFAADFTGPLRSDRTGRVSFNTNRYYSTALYLFIIIRLTYSITEPVKSPNWSKYAKTTTTFFALLCLNHKTRYRSNTKGDFRLPYRPIVLAISKATRLLLEHLTLNNNNYLNALEESLFALKLCLTALNLYTLKSKQLSNISLTLICEDLRPSCARC
jgi:hypothetical protein